MDRLLQNNTIVKVIAGFLAILLWVTVHAGGDLSTPSGIAQSSQEVRDKQVTVLYDERSFSLVNVPKVNLTLHGPALDVLNAVTLGSQLQVIADATKLGEGTHEVQVFTTGLPKNVSVDAAKVTIKLEANVNREVPVKLNVQGKPKEGFSVGDALLNPKTVIVSGAKSVVDGVDHAQITVSLDDAEDAIHTSVPVDVVDANGKVIPNAHVSRDHVEVNIPITRPSKSVPLRLQFKGDLTAGFAVSSITQTNSVTVFGNSKALDALDSYPAPVIDLTGLDKDTKFTLTLGKIEGITTVQPDSVEVNVHVVQAVPRTFDAVPVKITGLKEGQSYTVASTTANVSVTVEGAKELIDKMTPSDVSAFIDLTNQPAGHQEMRVQVNTPNFIKVVSVNPQTIVLDVKK